MTIQPVATDEAPAAIGPYSQAVMTNGLLFTSGQLPIDPKSGTLITGNIEDCAHTVFKNIAAIAKASGTTLSNTVKTTVFLKNMGDFQRVNEVYKQYFSEPYPARSAIQIAALPLGAEIEVEAIISL